MQYLSFYRTPINKDGEMCPEEQVNFSCRLIHKPVMEEVVDMVREGRLTEMEMFFEFKTEEGQWESAISVNAN